MSSSCTRQVESFAARGGSDWQQLVSYHGSAKVGDGRTRQPFSSCYKTEQKVGIIIYTTPDVGRNTIPSTSSPSSLTAVSASHTHWTVDSSHHDQRHDQF